MSTAWFVVVCVLLGAAAGVWLTRELVVEAWRGRHPKQPAAPRPGPRPRRSLQDLAIDDLQAQYVRGQIESDEFEARVWQAMTGASSPEQIAEAEAIVAAKSGRDEEYWRRREARVKTLLDGSAANLAQIQEQHKRVRYRIETLESTVRYWRGGS